MERPRAWSRHQSAPPSGALALRSVGNRPSHFEQSLMPTLPGLPNWRLSTFLGNGLCLAQPPRLTRASFLQPLL